MNNPKKVFQYSPTKQYSYGSIWIAADSKEEADKIIRDESMSFNYWWFIFDLEIKGLSYSGESGVVIDNTGEF